MKTKTTSLKIHPAALVFPAMAEAEFERLKSDIEANGQEEPIVVCKGEVIDGRHRLKACRELGVEPEIYELPGDRDPTAFVLSANLHRRQLKPSQRAMIAANLASANLQAPLTIDQAGDLLGVSARTIEYAAKVLKGGCAELVALCEEGRSVATAAQFIDLADGKRNQSTIIQADGWKGVGQYIRDTASVERKKNRPKLSDVDKFMAMLPDKGPEEIVGAVAIWLEQQDERPAVERFRAVWQSADAAGQAAIRAMVLDDGPTVPVGEHAAGNGKSADRPSRSATVPPKKTRSKTKI
jgi:hypothetical protein